MFEFELPELLWILPLPWLVWRLAPPVSATSGPALRVPSVSDFAPLTGDYGGQPARRLVLILALLSWIGLVLAAARPQWLGEPIEVPVSGRDLMLAVDLSESMRETDFVVNRRPVDRLTATKAVARRFIEQRVGDRLGLILFGQQAYVHVPLTFDRETVLQLLDESVIGMAGRQTAIGDALGLAVKRLREEESPHKVLILMTDGRNTAGAVEPQRAAELAAEAGLTVHTIGIGADESIQRGFFGNVHINPSAELDENTLKSIAAKTGGRYFRARDTKELEKIYQLLDELEPIARESKSFRPRKSLYTWPLSVALLLGTAMVLLISLRR